jgi:predicted SAM-dependent methyltransferase
MKLHLGCGTHFLADRGWTDTDIEPADDHVLRLDMTEKFPFGDRSVDCVFSEHAIEHISIDAAYLMFRECCRVLRPGGKIRIATPELEFLIDLWQGPLDRLQQSYLYLKTGTTSRSGVCRAINNLMREGGAHKFIYDEYTLRDVMESTGFADVRRSPLMCSRFPELSGLENEQRMPSGMLALETMCLEGVKYGD